MNRLTESKATIRRAVCCLNGIFPLLKEVFRNVSWKIELLQPPSVVAKGFRAWRISNSISKINRLRSLKVGNSESS